MKVLRAWLLGALFVLPFTGCETVEAAPDHQSTPCVFNTALLTTWPGVCRPHALRYPADVVGHVERSIYDAALTFGVPYGLLLKIARCESDLNPRASNGTHFGIFQFRPDTFARGKAQMLAATGIEAGSYWDPRSAAYVAGYLFAVGEATSWSCEPATL